MWFDIVFKPFTVFMGERERVNPGWIRVFFDDPTLTFNHSPKSESPLTSSPPTVAPCGALKALLLVVLLSLSNSSDSKF